MNIVLVIFFFKQKTAYEMRISDWSSDVCSSDLAARAAGLSVKINMVALAGLNEDQLLPMLDWCAARGCDLTLIETMPLGEVANDRSDHYIPLHRFVAPLRAERAIFPIDKRTEIGRAHV